MIPTQPYGSFAPVRTSLESRPRTLEAQIPRRRERHAAHHTWYTRPAHLFASLSGIISPSILTQRHGTQSPSPFRPTSNKQKPKLAPCLSAPRTHTSALCPSQVTSAPRRTFTALSSSETSTISAPFAPLASFARTQVLPSSRPCRHPECLPYQSASQTVPWFALDMPSSQ